MPHTSKWFDQPSVGVCVVIVMALLTFQGAGLLALGLPLICTCGSIDLWHGNPSSPETSQHLIDWYTYTHVIHGFGFYLLLWLLFPKASFGLRLLLAVGLEVGWELFENTPFVMERYRQSALARGYFGDSVVNSIFDTVATVIGFVLARILPVWVSIAVVVGLELFLGLMIRDNFTLNIVQLIYPSEPLSKWQAGG